MDRNSFFQKGAGAWWCSTREGVSSALCPSSGRLSLELIPNRSFLVAAEIVRAPKPLQDFHHLRQEGLQPFGADAPTHLPDLL